MPARSVTSMNCMGPDGRTVERDLAGSCASLGDIFATAAAGTMAAGELWATFVLWMTSSDRVMEVEMDDSVLQPASAEIDVRKRKSLKARATIRNNSRGNGRTSSTRPSRIQPHLHQHG